MSKPSKTRKKESRRRADFPLFRYSLKNQITICGDVAAAVEEEVPNRHAVAVAAAHNPNNRAAAAVICDDDAEEEDLPNRRDVIS